MKKQEKLPKRDPDRFLSGVFLLSASTVIVKVIGLVYKIPMIAILGAQGMGYFNSAAEIYAVLCVISTAGLPVALSMLISANRERNCFDGIRRIDRAGMSLFLILGASGSFIMLAFARPIANFIGNADALPCILAIAPALFFVCISSAVRGYFQGFQNMLPTAVSQLIEAIGKLLFGICFASIASRRGMALPVVAAFAVLGLSLGTFLSALYLLICKSGSTAFPTDVPIQASRRTNHDSLQLLKIAIPITLSSSILSLTRLTDMALMMRRLQSIGYSVSQTNVLYGAYTTLAVPVFSLIPALITPIALVSVPQLSASMEANAVEDQATVVERSLRLTTLFSIPSAMGISVYAQPILSMLFVGESEAIAIAAPLLAVLGISIPFSGLITTTNALLQSCRQMGKPILSMSIGATVKLLSAYLLLGDPRVGIYGAPISTLLCNLVVTGLNLIFLRRALPCVHQKNAYKQMYWKPTFAAILAILASLASYLPIRSWSKSETLAMLSAVVVAGGVYVWLLILMRAVTQEDWALLPMGTRIRDKMEEYKNKKIKIKDGMKHDS